MKDATKLVMKKTLQQSARGNERNPDCIRGLPVRFNSSLSLRGHRSYLIIKPSNFSFCLLMRREKERDEIRERMYALYLTSKGSPANNELYYIYIFFFLLLKLFFILGGGGVQNKNKAENSYFFFFF
jgi:hypothetical protein